MDHGEQRRILEEIARESSNPNARVSAIRALRQMDEAEAEQKQAETENKFANLDEWRRLRDVEPRRGGPKGA
jgi:hypothetical protein